MTEKSTGRPSAAKGGFGPALALGGPNPGASRRLCPGRYARALTDFVFEEDPRSDETRREQMELRRVDPRILKKNPRNPRNIQPGEMSDAALAANISAIGILQPPAVTEKNGELTIAYGARRVRIAIAIGLPEIDVLVKILRPRPYARGQRECRPRSHGDRRPMARHRKSRFRELDRRGHRLRAWRFPPPDPQAASARDRPPGDPRPDRRGRHAEGTGTAHHRLGLARDQAAVWKKFKPKKGEGAIWWQIDRALQNTHFFARDANSARPSARPSASSGRKTFSPSATRTIASPSTARPSSRPNAHGSTPTCRRTASGSKSTNTAARNCRRGRTAPGRSRRKATRSAFRSIRATAPIHEVVFRVSEPDAKKGKNRSISGGDDAPAPKKTRPEITQKGTEIVGALRAEALVKSLEVDACDDMTLIGLLVLAFDARNVTDPYRSPDVLDPDEAVQSIAGHRLAHDAERWASSHAMLAAVLSCSLGEAIAGRSRASRGRPRRRRAYRRYGDGRLPRCLSKAGSEGRSRPARSAAPARQGTRAEVIDQASARPTCIPAALFALTKPNRAPRQRRRIHRESIDPAGRSGHRRRRRRRGRTPRQRLRRGRRRSQRRTGARWMTAWMTTAPPTRTPISTATSTTAFRDAARSRPAPSGRAAAA